jgi:phosphonate degradation associated HDIG domain protein
MRIGILGQLQRSAHLATDDIDATTDEIVGWYVRHGGDSYIGEPVTQLQHAAQCAELARQAGASDDVVCAAFLHDIGHLCCDGAEQMGEFGTADHEQLGAAYLRANGIPERIAHLVGEHVNAKRYLTFKHPQYAAKLSAASTRTLQYQGGPMTAAEAADFESGAAFTQILQLRAWDEAAKEPGRDGAPLAYYRTLIAGRLREQRANDTVLAITQLESWRKQGYLKIAGFFSAAQRSTLREWVDDFQQRDETAGKWMKYFESGHAGTRQLCRVENFLPFHDGLEQLINGPRTLAIVAALFGEPAVLFKEKINYKLPGGNGFAPHQDAPAFTSFGQSIHITLMISVDATTQANGCLEVAPHPGALTTLPVTDDLTIAGALVEQMPWSPIPTEPGDLLFFDSYLPHRSGPNRTDLPRRALYVTYNKAAEGNRRDAYYREKRAVFPPDVERVPGRDYSTTGVFNVGNPIR